MMTSNFSDISHLPVLMARQPIFDLSNNIVAYELLFRQFNPDAAEVIDGDAATSEVLLDAFTNLHIADVLGDKKAFINFTRNLIGNPLPFDKSRLVIEVLEDVECDAELVEVLNELSASGYTIALDDFTSEGITGSLAAHADIIKVDVLEFNPQTLKEEVARLRPFNKILLAEKVENHHIYNYCKGLGFSLFQGHYLSKPELISGRKVPAAKLVVLNLLQKLQDPDCEISELESLINQDPVLCIKVLKLANSSLYSPRSPVETIGRAITYLGLGQMRTLVTMLALSNLSDKPNALKIQCLVRARMCALLGREILPEAEQSCFAVGLLASLDAFFDQPLTDILDSFPLAAEIRDAILHYKGDYGMILRAVRLHEDARWNAIDWSYFLTRGIDHNTFNRFYHDSITWQAEADLL
ncbi:MAG: HDOD domain-containing protein [Pseudomonadales bacterium]|nr:HDOD domain-containing protein [Pseudomonadales bacterium]